MNWQLLTSFRYLTSKHKEKFISLISLISVLGITVGVAALIIVIAVMSGFDSDLKDKIIGTYSHVEIRADYGMPQSEEFIDKVTATPHVKAASFFLIGQSLIQGGDSVTGVMVKGIEPAREVKVNKLGEYIKEGVLTLAEDDAVIGSELASHIGVKVGGTITVISSFDPEGRTFAVRGIFTSGMYEYDANLVYVSIPDAQELLGAAGLVSGVSIRVDDAMNVDLVKGKLQEWVKLPYMVRTWADLNKNLVAALKLEKTVMFIILALIVMVACFNIAGTLIMTVLEKTKDIGILKSIGATSRDVMVVFALQGGIIGIIGTLLGTLLGVSVCYLLKTYKFISLPKDIYYIDTLPVRLDIADLTLIVASSLIISLIATIYPAHKASKLDPVEALRYE